MGRQPRPDAHGGGRPACRPPRGEALRRSGHRVSPPQSRTPFTALRWQNAETGCMGTTLGPPATAGGGDTGTRALGTGAWCPACRRRGGGRLRPRRRLAHGSESVFPSFQRERTQTEGEEAGAQASAARADGSPGQSFTAHLFRKRRRGWQTAGGRTTFPFHIRSEAAPTRGQLPDASYYICTG